MLDTFFSSEIVRAMGWSLLHSLWQGALLAVVLGILLASMRRFSSATRYLIIALFMALLTATLPVNFIRQYYMASPYSPGITQSYRSVTSLPGNSERSPHALRSAPEQVSELEPVVNSSTLTEKISSLFVGYFEHHLPLLVTLWLLGILILLLRYLGQFAYVQRVKHYGVRPFPAAWNEMIVRLESRLKITRRVQYLESWRIASPMMIGWLKPVILFPVGLVSRLTPVQVEAILLHELAHIKRHDYLLNILQSLTTILLFYHPASWWISRLLDEERENCCDDLVVELSGQRNSYATTLIHLQEQTLITMKTSLAFTGTPSGFSGRILRILNGSVPSANSFREGFVTALVVLAGLGFLGVAGSEAPAKPVVSSLQPEKKSEESAKLSAQVISPNSSASLPEPEQNTGNSTSLRLKEQTAEDKEKVDILIQAIDDGDERLFKYILAQGIDINQAGSEDWTPLGFAAREGQLHFVKLLLDRGAKADYPINHRHSPLLAAASEGHVEVVKLLLERGATAQVKAGEYTALSLAAREGHVEVVRFLIDQGVPAREVNEHQESALTLAAREGQLDVVELLLSKEVGAAASQQVNKALVNAAQEGQLDVVRLLLGGKSNISKSVVDDALVGAASEGHLAVVEALLEQAGKGTKSETAPKVLVAAAGEGHLPVVEKLLAAGIPPDASSAEGATALARAAGEGHLSVVAYLLANGAAIDKANHEGKTPLHFATIDGQVKVMQRLIAAGADIEAKASTSWFNGNFYGTETLEGKRVILGNWTPLLFAVEEKNLQAAEVLLKAGANANVQAEKTVYLAKQNSSKEEVTAKGLLYAATGWTPLMEAVEKQYVELVQLLLASGADKNAQTREGISVSSIAAKTGNSDIIQLLK